jgi:transposase-like protein
MAADSSRRRPYPPEFRREAVALYRSSGKSLKQMSDELGIATESLRARAKQQAVDVGDRDEASLAPSVKSSAGCARRTNAWSRSAICSSEPRPSSPRRPRSGEHLPVHLGGEGPHPVSICCEVPGVSRSGYYGWAGRPPSAREFEDQQLLEQIKRIWQENRKVYGSPRIHAELP